jgi:pentatricopeptide repeat protein
MRAEGLSPDAVTFACILKACGEAECAQKGKEIHSEIFSKGLLEKDVVLGNVLIHMYVKCGALDEARKAIEGLPLHDVVSWSVLMSGYAEHGQCHEALECHTQMQSEGLCPDRVSFICILKACGNIGFASKGEEIHKEILSRGLLDDHDVVLGTATIDMYAKCGVLAKAREVLEGLPTRNEVSWNALISGYAQKGLSYEALDCLGRMQNEGMVPNAVTFICILKACGSMGLTHRGQCIHADVLSRGLLHDDIDIGNALVDMYAKCGLLMKALQVLEELPVRDVVSWSTIITAFALQGQNQEALNCLESMKNEGLSPDAITFISALNLCGSISAIKTGGNIHEEIVCRGSLEKDIVLGTALVDMYAKCGELVKAEKVLEGLSVRNAVVWNALIVGSTQQGRCHEAVNYFEAMRRESFSPDAVTYTCILKACGSIGAIDKGKQIHEEILNRGLIKSDLVLGTAVVDMYAKCGSLTKAQKVLEELPDRDVVAWNVLIAGYALQGEAHEALKCFSRIQTEGITPDEVTFLCVLSACGRMGLVDDARMLFQDMSSKYGISPSVEHHICMIVVFGYGGQFDKAMSVIELMQSSNFPTVWLALLGACRRWGNVELGKLAFDQVIQLDDSNSAAYVLMASLFADVGMQEDAENIEATRWKYAA